MENASKALLIAGAILIVILLIAVGMMVYNGAKGSINKAIGQMSSTEKDIHNSQFESYIGTNVSGSNVKSLISKVSTNNADENNVNVDLDGDTTDINDVVVSARLSYTVTLEYTDGVVTIVHINSHTP